MIIPVRSFISLNKILKMIHDSPDLKSCQELKLLGGKLDLLYLQNCFYLHAPNQDVLYFVNNPVDLLDANRAGKVASCK